MLNQLQQDAGIYLSHVKCAAQCIFVRNSHLVWYAMSRTHCADEESIKIILKCIEGKRFRKTTCEIVVGQKGNKIFLLQYKTHLSSTVNYILGTFKLNINQRETYNCTSHRKQLYKHLMFNISKLSYKCFSNICHFLFKKYL